MTRSTTRRAAIALLVMCLLAGCWLVVPGPPDAGLTVSAPDAGGLDEHT